MEMIGKREFKKTLEQPLIKALAKKKIEEGKRKRYEGRMMRKAKREGRSDLEYYLRQGAAVPTVEEIDMLCSLSYEGQLKAWKANDHSMIIPSIAWVITWKKVGVNVIEHVCSYM